MPIDNIGNVHINTAIAQSSTISGVITCSFQAIHEDCYVGYKPRYGIIKSFYRSPLRVACHRVCPDSSAPIAASSPHQSLFKFQISGGRVAEV